MLNYSEIFNIQKTVLPLTKKELTKILSKEVFTGYVQCPYSMLVDTLTDISKADEYDVTINIERMYQQGQNPFERADVVIKVEGMRDYSEFVNGVISQDEDKEWTDFMTYSTLMRDEIKNAKCMAIKNTIWNAKNIQAWFDDSKVALPEMVFTELTTDFEKFKETVLNTPDLYGFINACDETELKKANDMLVKKLIFILTKHRHELNAHVSRKTRDEMTIKIKKPIINRIFIVSQFANSCRKDWPKIKFTALDKRTFDSIGIWGE